MKEFIQAVLISVSIVFTVGFVTNGFKLSPEREQVSAMDMSEMDHSTMTETSPGEVEVPAEIDHSEMDMSGMAH